MGHYLNYWGNVLPKCPHCNEDFRVWDGDNPLSLNYDDGGITPLECTSCGRGFFAVTKVEYKFSSAVSEESAEDDEWGPQEVAAV